ncbi:hypothetical protein FHS95_002825 [Sphingomonas naasensis]|uniref:Uncharacterized protein n=1 Tax=Sphingomonas naasensis TaxID=1344951 RepID=A0A4V3QVD6_9SPHN|nr:hypothetical protein [Sphingomonas naasensis]NIJ21122.1 hypothetical protein [Sphingomonas naasensis]TGX38292.1 hypothetical protein E5A74_18910 [Sphingomonas naasensis]
MPRDTHRAPLSGCPDFDSGGNQAAGIQDMTSARGVKHAAIYTRNSTGESLDHEHDNGVFRAPPLARQVDAFAHPIHVALPSCGSSARRRAE